MLRFIRFFCLFLLTVSSGGAEEERTPNLIFILADDLGYGDLSCYGAPDIRTPHIDRLASEGIRFTDFYANGAVCSPTRIAFLTGQYQQRLGMDNALYYQEKGRGLAPAAETIATRLKMAGYHTGLSGKWHVGYDFSRHPLQQGFDHFFGLLGGNHHYFEHMDRIGVPDLWLGNSEVKQAGYSTDLFSEDAISFVRKNKANPFFLFLSHAAPHFPWQGPDDADKLIRPRKREWQQGDRETYIAMVESMDSGIGKLLSELDRLGIAKNTLVVFTSDNGGDVYSRNKPLRGRKSELWEGGIRVPCVARWPDKISAGEVSDQVGVTMDWTITFAAVAGDNAKHDADEGINLLPVLNGEAKTIDRILFWRKRPGPVRKKVQRERAIRSGKWKYLEPATENPMLIDLSSDIGETQNAIDSHPKIAADLKSRLDEWDQKMDAAFSALPRK